MMFNNKYEKYDDFLRECWSKHINDNLLSCIVPMDNTTVSRYRKEIKVCANGQTTSKPMIARAFEILEKPEYRFIFETINPLRVDSNVKFWETGTAKRDNLFDYFMLLRQKLWNKIVEEANSSRTNDSVQMSFDDLPNEHLTETVKTKVEVKNTPVETCKDSAELLMEDTNLRAFRRALEELVTEGVKMRRFSLANKLIAILESEF